MMMEQKDVVCSHCNCIQMGIGIMQIYTLPAIKLDH